MYVKFLYESYMLSFIFVNACILYWKMNMYVIKLKPFTAVSFKCKNMFRAFEQKEFSSLWKKYHSFYGLIWSTREALSSTLAVNHLAVELSLPVKKNIAF